MPIEFRNMKEEPPVSKLKLGIVGKEKHGKSQLAGTGRPMVLFHDFDNRAEALQGKPGVFVISYVEPQWPKQPEAAQLFLDIMAKLEETLDLFDLAEFLRKKFPKVPQIPKGTIIGTNVIDSIQTFGKAFQNYALFGQSSIRREISFAGATPYKVFLPGGWDAWNAEMQPVENMILRMLALPTDTILIFHETPEETPDSTSEKPKYTGRVSVFPVRYQRLIKYLNELWRVKLTQSVVPPSNKLLFTPKVYPFPNSEFDGASALLIDEIENPSIVEMIAKHEGKLKLQLQTSGAQKALLEGKKL